MRRNLIIEEDLDFISNANLPWKILENKTIMITGANGFLPAYMVETLLYLKEIKIISNIKVIGIVRNIQKAKERFKYYQERSDLEFIVHDLSQPFNTNIDVHYIVHAASQASPKYFGIDPVGTILPNVIGTVSLLDLAKEKKCEGFLFISSGEVYGNVNEDQVPTKENEYGHLDPTEVRSCYSESKRLGETLCVAYNAQYGVPTKIARPFHTYGPGMLLNDGRVYADFISDIINNRNIIMKSDGSAIRSFCYIADAVLGFFTILLKGNNAESYNVGNNKMKISINDLANTLTSIYPEKKLKVISSIRKNTNNYMISKISINCPDVSKIKPLGWEPIFSIKDGFKRTIDSFLNRS